MTKRDGTWIALLGEDRGHRSHQELNALRSMLDVRTAWVATDSGTSLEGFDGIWLVPGSPYADDVAAYEAIRRARENGIPFLGSCGGLQYAVIESVRNWLGGAASHEESDGVADDNVVTKLACSLYGEVRQVVPSPGTWFADLMGVPFDGTHFCNFAPTPGAVDQLVAAGVELGATSVDTPVQLLRWPDHPFFVATLFQPHIGALAGMPVHPLIRAFIDAAAARHAGTESTIFPS